MKLFEHIEGLVSGKLSIIKMGIEIIKLETRLAGLSVFPLLINIILLLIVLMTTWLVGMGLAGYGLFVAFKSIAIATLSVFFLNIGLLAVLLSYLSFNLKNMSFEKTREYFSNKMDNDYDKLQKANNRAAASDRKKIKIPTT